MSQTTVKNFTFRVDTLGLTALFLQDPNPSKTAILEYVTLYGEGYEVKREKIEGFPIILDLGEDVNFTLINTQLTSSSRVFFHSEDGSEQPFKINGQRKGGILSGNFHMYAVSLHLKADQILSLSDLSFNVFLVPANRSVSDSYSFTIDPKLRINQP